MMSEKLIKKTIVFIKKKHNQPFSYSIKLQIKRLGVN